MEADGGNIGDDTAHLFDDSKFGNIYTALDIQERARTKRANAREDLALQHREILLRQEQRTLAKSYKKEMLEIRERLKDIHAKTPNFVTDQQGNNSTKFRSKKWTGKDRSLGSESQVNVLKINTNGLNSFQNDSGNSQKKNVTFNSAGIREQLGTIQESNTAHGHRERNNQERNTGSQTEVHTSIIQSTKRSLSLPNLSRSSPLKMTGSNPNQHRNSESQLSFVSKATSVELPKIQALPEPRERTFRKPLSFQKDTIKPSTKSYIRRASYLSKSLGDLYAKRDNYGMPKKTQQIPLHKANFVLYTSKGQVIRS